MITEDEVPVRERYLWIEGFLSKKAVRNIQRALPTDISENSRICFVGFAYAHIPLPKRYDILFPYSHAYSFCDQTEDAPLRFKSSTLTGAIECEIQVLAATQQFALPMTALNHGWKSICVVQFDGPVPPVVDALPTVDSWHESKMHIALCSYDTITSLIDASCPE